jgi:hypothetical protein
MNNLLFLKKHYIILSLIGLVSCQDIPQTNDDNRSPLKKEIILKADSQFQTIDGFGVNITPAQWRNGNLKPVIDMLIDDLGCTLIRFDCFGKADWLNPARQNPDKTFSEEYLAEVYTSKVFTDAWEAFRYFNAKGLEPILNISGKIPPEWAGEDAERLVDFESYAEMALSLLKWARFNENLKFSLFMPFNETNLGFPEGPFMKAEDCVPATIEIWERMKKNGLDDVKLVVMGDSHVVPENIEAFINERTLKEVIYSFSAHTYGNGFDDDARDRWPWGDSPFKQAVDMISNSQYRGKPLWITEYGDLDQTREIEFEFAWRSTRRLVRFLNDGCSAAQAWDAFDNFHVHDSEWAIYGLLRTDTLNWSYAPKKRYYAAKQIYKYVLPGFVRIKWEGIGMDPDHRYALWQNPFKNMEISAYISPTESDFSIIGMSWIEREVELFIDLNDLGNKLSGKMVKVYTTSGNADCIQIFESRISAEKIKVPVPERSIFTITTL